jgi:formylmethanofuran dehydrogenase subunit E
MNILILISQPQQVIISGKKSQHSPISSTPYVLENINIKTMKGNERTYLEQGNEYEIMQKMTKNTPKFREKSREKTREIEQEKEEKKKTKWGVLWLGERDGFYNPITCVRMVNLMVRTTVCQK